MDASNVKITISLQRTCVALAALVTICIVLALTTNGVGQRHVWPFTNGIGAKQGAHQEKSRILELLNKGLQDIDEEADFRENVLREQAERQQRLARGCISVVASSSETHLRTDLSLVVNVPLPLGITYCAMPKCGTTTWFSFFERVTGRVCQDLEVHACARRKFRRPWSPMDFLPRSLVIVRDPWRRLVSAFADKFVAERHALAASCYRRSGKSLHSSIPVTFSEFVSCILAEYRSGLKLNHHYAPQHWQCSLCRANYSFIAKMETFAEDFRYLATHVFLDRDYEAYQTTFERPSASD